jgi:hypothetical protein
MNSQTIFSERLRNRERLLAELRENIEYKIQPLVMQARKTMAVIPFQRITHYKNAGLLSEVIADLNKLCQRIDFETTDQLFVFRVHQALEGCQTQNANQILITGNTMLTTPADQEKILSVIYRITALCKTSACCIQEFKLIMKSNEQCIVLKTIQESDIQAENFCCQLAAILRTEQIKLVRTKTMGGAQIIHLTKFNT